MDLRAMLKALVFTQLLPTDKFKNNGAFGGNTYVDTLGLSAVLFLFDLGTTDVIVGSTDTSHALKIEECDTTGGTYTDVTGAALAAVLASTGDSKLRAIFVDLSKSHKRYMKVNAPTAGNATGANLSILAIGFPSDQMPKSAAEMGLAELIEA
jgi:hypothetical protein